MRGMRYPDPELIQKNAMRIHFPDFRVHRNNAGYLVFTGRIQPKKSMASYKVSIEFRWGDMPRVRVHEPFLDAKAPHTYKSLDCLCLYKPSNFKWTATKPISNYIVPWAACWLYFYEVWKDRGVWVGPEANHERSN